MNLVVFVFFVISAAGTMSLFKEDKTELPRTLSEKRECGQRIDSRT